MERESRAKHAAAATILIAAALCGSSAVEARAASLRYRVLARGAVQQAVDGRLWLYGAGWGWMDRIALGRIRAGDLETDFSEETFPARWPFAAHHGYFLAIEAGRGRWYRSEMLVSRLEPAEKSVTRTGLVAAVPRLLEQIGVVQRFASGERTLILPEQVARRITLLHEDGTPLAGQTFGADVLVWRQNHCGVAMGLGSGVVAPGGGGAFGSQTTNAAGSFTLHAPRATLMLRLNHYPRADSASGAVLRKVTDIVEIPPGGDLTIRSRWDQPRPHPVSIRLTTHSGQPIVGRYVDWSLNTDTCGPPIQIEGPSDANGWIRFEAAMELTASMSVYDSDVREGGPWDRRLIRRLSREEILELVRNRTATILLEPVR